MKPLNGILLSLAVGSSVVFLTTVSAGSSLGNVERMPVLFSLESAKRTEFEVANTNGDYESELDYSGIVPGDRGVIQLPSTVPDSTLVPDTSVPDQQAQQPAVNSTPVESTNTTSSTVEPTTGTVPSVDTTTPEVDAPVELPENPTDSSFLDETNEVRAEDLIWSDELARYADIHLQQMMVGNALFHSNISVLLANWSVVGENVGVGPSVISIQEAMMASPTHRENVTFESYTHFGSSSRTGIDGRIWSVHVFGAR